MADTRDELKSSPLPESLNVALLPFSNSSAYSDIKFKVGSSDQIFYGHKVILSARSPVFAAMFKSSLMIPEDGVVIPDVEPRVFQIFLDLIYGEICKPVGFMTQKSQSSSSAEVSADNVSSDKTSKSDLSPIKITEDSAEHQEDTENENDHSSTLTLPDVPTTLPSDVIMITVEPVLNTVVPPRPPSATPSGKTDPNPGQDEYLISVEEAIGVLYIAEKYLVSNMSSKWRAQIMANMKPEQSLAFYRVSTSLIELGAMDVLAQTETLMDNECAKILASSDFLELNQEDLSNYLKRDGLVIHEIDLFKAVIRWATAHCESKNLPATSENLRTALEPIIYFIRFPTMTIIEFTEEVISTEILTMEQALEIYKCYGKKPPTSTAIAPYTTTVGEIHRSTGGSTEPNQSRNSNVLQTFSTVCRRIPVPPAPARHRGRGPRNVPDAAERSDSETSSSDDDEVWT